MTKIKKNFYRGQTQPQGSKIGGVGGIFQN